MNRSAARVMRTAASVVTIATLSLSRIMLRTRCNGSEEEAQPGDDLLPAPALWLRFGASCGRGCAGGGSSMSPHVRWRNCVVEKSIFVKSPEKRVRVPSFILRPNGLKDAGKVVRAPEGPQGRQGSEDHHGTSGPQAAPTFTSDSSVTRSCTRYRVQKDTSLAAALAAASLIIRALDCV
jgi:hypothetical protein